MAPSSQLDALLHGWFYGNFYVRFAGAVGFAFLMGSIPVGPVVAWLFADVDRRVARAAGALVPACNAVKAFVAVGIVAHGGGPAIGYAAGTAALFGHCFCPWRRFRGGKGVAVEAGVLLGLCWPAAFAFAAVWLVAAVSSNYAIVGSLLASIVAIVSLWFFLGPYGALFALSMLLLIAGRHASQFAALGEGREPLLRPDVVRRPSVVRADRQAVEGI